MSKKKAIKITTATAIAASAFVAVAPTQSEAATSSVDKAITKATNQMAKAYDTYHKTAKNENKLPKTATIRKEVKLAQDYYTAATKEIAKNGGSKTKKAAYTKTLNAKKHFLDRAEAYLAAINTNLNPAKTAFKTAVETGKAKNVVSAKAALVKDVDAFKATVAKIYGPDVRGLLLEKYEAPATELSNSVNDELKVYEAYKKIEAGKLADLEETAKLIDSVKKEADALKGKDTKLATTLAAVVAKNDAAYKEAYDAAQIPVVKEVSAINATQVEVKFNKELAGTDFDTQGEARTIFKLTGETVDSAELSEDGKTVTVTFTNSIEGSNSEFIVEPVQTTKFDANNQPVNTLKHVQVFTYEDTKKPEIVSVTSTAKGGTATSLTVVASEPIQSALAKINGSYVSVNFNGTDTATITGLALDVAKSHTVELLNLTDKAATPNVTTLSSKSFNVTVDASAPTVSVSTTSEKEIELTFSKRMDEATLEAAATAGTGLGFVKDESLNNVQLASYAGGTGYVKEVAGSKGTKFTVAVSASLFTTGKTVRNFTVLLPESVTDSLGNSVGTQTKSVTLTKDTSKPSVTGYKVVKDSQGRVSALEVEFSEGLAGGTPAVPTIVNENGVAVLASSFLGGLTPTAITAGDKKVVYTAATPAKISGKFAFSFGSSLVSDLAETANNSEAFNHTFDFGSASAGSFDLTSAVATSPTSNIITVNFGTAVKGGAVANSATDVNNYSLGGKPLPAGTTITLNSAQTAATIILADNSIAATDATTVFTVANVDALNGAKLNAYNGTVATSDNVQPVLNSGTLTADNKLAVGFSEALATSPVAGDLVFKINGNTVTNAGSVNLTVTPGTGSDAGKYLVNLDGLVKQGTTVAATPGTPGNAGPDGTAGNADDVAAIPGTPASTTPSYVDVNNNNAYDTATDIKIGDGPVAGFKFSTSSAISSVTVTTAAGTRTGADLAGNTLTSATTVTVK